MPNSDGAKAFESMVGAAGAGSNVVIYTQMAINLVLSASMAPLWGMINALQVVMHM